MSWWSDFVLAVEAAAGGESNVAGPAGAANATVPAPVGGILTALGITSYLTDGKMWRSLGWLFLGIILMLLGVAWWIGPAAARVSPAGAVARQLS
jgi:hypothetical protein